MNTETTEKLREDLRSVAADVESLLKHVAEGAGEQGDHVRARLHQLRARVEGIEQRADARVRRTGNDIDRYVHEKPWLLLGAAAGLGFLLGAFNGHRHASRS